MSAHSCCPAAQEKEYQVLSDVPGSMEALVGDQSLTADAHQHQDMTKLSNAKVEEEVLSASLVYWRDPGSPQQLMRFGDMADFGVPQVGSPVMHACTHSQWLNDS